jgi:hypothetical protein
MPKLGNKGDKHFKTRSAKLLAEAFGYTQEAWCPEWRSYKQQKITLEDVHWFLNSVYDEMILNENELNNTENDHSHNRYDYE